MFTTTVSTKAFDESLRQAKARLSDMHVQEVSLVDAAANLRRWVVVKGLGMSVEINKGLKLPPAALKALKEGVAKELTTLVKLAEVLGTCEADEKASVPSELGKYLAASSLSIAGLAKQYGGDVDVPQGTEPTQKRGAKISAKRLAALKSAHESLGSVIAGADPAYIAEKASKPPQIDDEEDEDTTKATGKKPEEDKPGDMQKAIDAAVEAGVKKALAEVEKKTAQQGEELAKANAEIAKLRGQTPAPASQPIDAAQADNGDKVIWGSDLAAEVQKRKQK